MKATFHTRCGCTQEKDIPEALQRIQFPMYQYSWERPVELDYALSSSRANFTTVRTREFDLVEKHYGPFGPMLHYLEVF
jgi:hypothetical protein